MIALVISAIVQSVPAVEAELLLREMEVKISSANSARIEFTIVPIGQGTLLLAHKNRIRLEFKWKDAKGKTEASILYLGDGKGLQKQLVAEREGIDSGGNQPMPLWYNAVLQSWLGRGGAFLSMESVKHLSNAKKPGLKEGPQTSNARLLPDEKVNGMNARVVEYDLEWPAAGSSGFEKWKIRFWIDAKTKLPLRRTMSGLAKNVRTWPLTETYTKFEIDPKLDDKLFVIPK